MANSLPTVSGSSFSFRTSFPSSPLSAWLKSNIKIILRKTTTSEKERGIFYPLYFTSPELPSFGDSMFDPPSVDGILDFFNEVTIAPIIIVAIMPMIM